MRGVYTARRVLRRFEDFTGIFAWRRHTGLLYFTRTVPTFQSTPTRTMSGLNANPELFALADERRSPADVAREADPLLRDPLDDFEVFDMIRGIKDPEHPHTLEQLRVAQRTLIHVDDKRGRVAVNFTPTIPHCSMATLIGLSIRVQLLRSLPTRFKVDVKVTPGTHMNELDVNKQLNDKERVAAALENDNLLRVVNQCLQGVVADG